MARAGSNVALLKVWPLGQQLSVSQKLVKNANSWAPSEIAPLG